MDKKELFRLYETLYFHEIEAREKLNSRLQTPLTLIVSLVGALAFLVQNYEHRPGNALATSFVFSSLLAAAALIVATHFFVRSWMGTKYFFLPSALETDAYRQTLVAHYAPYEHGDEIASEKFSEYVLSYYIKYSSANTDANDIRSLYIHRTNIAIIAAAALAFVAFLFFYFGDFDKAKVQKTTEVLITKPVVVTGEIMTTNKPVPPPPPPPPPPRQIREGVEIIKRPPPR